MIETEAELGLKPRSDRRSEMVWAARSVVAAFGAYFCVYAFRKPFTSSTFSDGKVWGIGEKTVLVTAQVIGYMLSKLIGIRVVAEMAPERRSVSILILVAMAEAALVLFAMAPSPLHVVGLFLNGLALGMVFGMVLGFLEGRRVTEALTAGLCASFILADGVTKSVGTWLLNLGVTDRWMPALAGLMFVPFLLVFVWMLGQIPRPNAVDVASRSERPPMDRHDRASLIRRYAPGLVAIVGVFLVITIARSIRADFGPELWKALGIQATPSTFATSELLVALGVLVANGLSILIVDNRRAFFASLGVAGFGVVLMVIALIGLGRSWLGGFEFMVLMGVGLYLPYVAIHTTVFERLIAMTRERANIGFLMYLADAAGYLGFAAVMIGKALMPQQGDFLLFYLGASWLIAGLGLFGTVLAVGWFSWSARKPAESPTGVPS